MPLPGNQRYTTDLVLYQITIAFGRPQLLPFHLVNPVLRRPSGGRKQGICAGAIMVSRYQRRESVARPEMNLPNPRPLPRLPAQVTATPRATSLADRTSGKPISDSPGAFHSTNASNSSSGARHSISSIAPSTACRWKKSGCHQREHHHRALSRRYPQQAQPRLEPERRARFNSHCGWNSKCKSALRFYGQETKSN